jgi:hypothetical protein
LPDGYRIVNVVGGGLIAHDTIDLTGSTGQVRVHARVRKS